MSKSENKAFLSAYERYFDLEIARSALAGSILQIAYNCLKRHSPGPLDLNMCSKFGIPHGATSEKLCLGRLVHGIPIGLLIYAGRIQYNHWEDGLPSNPVAKAVFQELVMAYINDTSFDMAYELDFPEPHPVAHFIVRFELKWRNYDDYINDMHSLLKLT